MLSSSLTRAPSPSPRAGSPEGPAWPGPQGVLCGRHCSKRLMGTGRDAGRGDKGCPRRRPCPAPSVWTACPKAQSGPGWSPSCVHEQLCTLLDTTTISVGIDRAAVTAAACRGSAAPEVEHMLTKELRYGPSGLPRHNYGPPVQRPSPGPKGRHSPIRKARAPDASREV
jgi:hypothetical protein